MEITVKSGQLYQKVETIRYNPTKEELFYYYGGTNSGINPNNPYARKNSHVKKFQYVPVKKTTSKSKRVIK